MKPVCKKIVGYWHYGVILTYLSVAAAITGIVLSFTIGAGWGVICLFVSGLCDSFDGAVAKTRKDRTDDDRKFGEQIDSLSDVIAFGVAPIAVGIGMGYTQWYFIVLYVFYVLCALVRLAYFNVTEEAMMEEGGKRESYEGLPVTISTLILPPMYLMATMFLGPVVELPIVTAIAMALTYFVTAILFIARFRCPKWHVKEVIIATAIAVVCIVALVLVRLYVFGVTIL